jgi:hypothetical protein
MIIKPGKYQHYKGNFYQVLGMARHSETLEEMVIYQGLYNSPEFGDHPIWVRPVKKFFENVDKNGEKIARFKYIEEK